MANEDLGVADLASLLGRGRSSDGRRKECLKRADCGLQESPREGPDSAPKPPFECEREIGFTALSRRSYSDVPIHMLRSCGRPPGDHRDRREGRRPRARSRVPDRRGRDLEQPVHRAGSATAVPAASSASESYRTGDPLEKIATTDHIGRRRRRHPAHVGLEICAKHE
jgi:hypothetical protein